MIAELFEENGDMQASIRQTMDRYFGFLEFKDGQEEVIHNILCSACWFLSYTGTQVVQT